MNKDYSLTNTIFLLNTGDLSSPVDFSESNHAWKVKHVHNSFQDCFSPDCVPNVVSCFNLQTPSKFFSGDVDPWVEYLSLLTVGLFLLDIFPRTL